MNKKVFIIGAGGHAKVVLENLLSQDYKVEGFLDQNKQLWNTEIMGHKVLGSDDLINNYDPNEILLVNGIGSACTRENTGLKVRTKIFNIFASKGYKFLNAIHSSAVISKFCNIGQSTQIMAGSIIQPSVKIGENVIINTKSSIDHDCDIGDNSHIAPGSTICGSVKIGKGSFIGSGAIIIQGIDIGDNVIVAAGATVRKNIPSNQFYK